MVFLTPDPELPEFPTMDYDQLVGILDAAHGTDLKTRRSVTGIAIFFCGAVIAWKSKLQPTVSTSSTEAEFIAAVQCAKLVIYLRSVLSDLRLLKEGPTPLLIDNEAALKVINERRPTNRVRHVEIQHFAIQEWRKAGHVILQHVPGTINPSDDLTKPLSWILHGRHARRNMGHYDGTLKMLTSSTEHQAGESVENRPVAIGSSFVNESVVNESAGATHQPKIPNDPTSKESFVETRRSS